MLKDDGEMETVVTQWRKTQERHVGREQWVSFRDKICATVMAGTVRNSSGMVEQLNVNYPKAENK